MDYKEHFIISMAFTGITTLILGIFVYFKNRKNKINVTFALYSSSIAWWSLTQIGNVYGPSLETSWFWARIEQMGVVFIPTFFVHFVVAFLELKRKWLLRFCYTFSTIIALLSPTTSLISPRAESKFGIINFGEPGPLYHVLIVFFVIFIVYSLWKLLEAYKGSTGAKRNQLKYLLWPSLVGYIGGGANFLLVYDISIYPLNPFGTYFVGLYTFAIAYAIVRHQLMDIEVIIKKTVVFASLLAFISGIFIVVAFLVGQFLGGGRFLSIAITAVIIILTRHPLENFLINITDKFLFQKKYDYKQLLKTFSNEILTMVDLRQLLKHSVTTLAEIVRLENCAILLKDKDTRRYEIKASHNVTSRVTFGENDEFLMYLKDRGTVLLPGRTRLPPAVSDAMKSLSSSFFFALVLHNDLIGILSLGKKKSDENYTQDDIDILYTIARSETIAISNALLFEELSVTQQEAAQKEKLAVIGTLAAGINHEVCNPLTIVKGRSEEFLLNYKDGLLENKSKEEIIDIARNMAEATISQVDRATKITTILSNFAKPPKDLKPKPTNVEDELNIGILLVSNSLKMDRIEIEKNIPQDLPLIMAGEKELQHIFFNIIRNAGQAMKEEGKITITAQRQNDKVLIDISDTGPGIPQDKLNKIFDPFFTTKSPGEGTGLGLFIVRQVVEKNGGRISVNSALGKGTVFSIELPVIA